MHASNAGNSSLQESIVSPDESLQAVRDLSAQNNFHQNDIDAESYKINLLSVDDDDEDESTNLSVRKGKLLVCYCLSTDSYTCLINCCHPSKPLARFTGALSPQYIFIRALRI